MTSLAKEQFEKSRALYEAALQADPENDLVVPELANLLWDLHENEDPTPLDGSQADRDEIRRRSDALEAGR